MKGSPESRWPVPDNWAWTRLSKIGDIVAGGTPSTKVPAYWADEIPWISPADLTGYTAKAITKGAKSISSSGLANSSAKMMPAGSVHFSSRAPIGYVVISSEALATNQGFKSLVPASGIAPDFAYYYLLASREYARQRASGTTFLELSGKAFGDLPIPVAPTAQQHRIVAKIEELFSELDKGVESLRTAKSTLDLYRKSLLKMAFEGRLTADWRARNPDKLEDPDILLARIREEREVRYKAGLHEWERAVSEWKKSGQKVRKPAKPKQFEEFGLLSPSDRLPWPRVRVQSLLDAPLINGRSVKDKPGGFPVLRLTALKNGRIDYRESKEGDWNQDDAEPFFVQRDDIFIARGSGSKNLVGIASLVRDDPEPVAFPDTMIRARLDTSAIRPQYFLPAWNSWTMRRQIEEAARTTAGIYKINQSHVRGFVLPLPSLAEQGEIVRILDARLEALEALDEAVDSSFARAEAVRQSILKKAFSGQLVAQDPNDEPASLLLERIKAEKPRRARNAKIRKKRRRAKEAA